MEKEIGKREELEPPKTAGAARHEYCFRAWSGEEMIYLKNSGLQYFDFEGSYSLGFTVDGYDGFWAHENYESQTKKAATFPIMQFTGLRDKNGRDIYEGDLVRHPTDGVFQIGFHVDRFEAVKERPILPDARSLWSVSNIVEVIGNIHENPELVK